jgi:uncharacterized protein YcbX
VTQPVGSVLSLWRYPVKSMMGEELDATSVTERGLLGDRAYALVDRSDEKVASAKNPKKWPQLLDYAAVFADPPRSGGQLPPLRITLPNGVTVSSQQDDLNQVLTRSLRREVTLNRADNGPPSPKAEQYWPDLEGLGHHDMVTDFDLPAGTFFDAAFVHLVTTATLEQLGRLHPEGRIDVRRFRPNLVVETPAGTSDFVENDWTGRTLLLGNEVRLRITRPCGRCVMTTLPQGDLPKDPVILRTAVQHNRAAVGVYASVARAGTLRRGDPVRLE